MGEIHILKLRDGEEFIKLGQALKATGITYKSKFRKEYLQTQLLRTPVCNCTHLFTELNTLTYLTSFVN